MYIVRVKDPLEIADTTFVGPIKVLSDANQISEALEATGWEAYVELLCPDAETAAADMLAQVKAVR